MDPFAGIGSDWGQGGRSSPTKVKEQERMEDGVDVRNNNHDSSVYRVFNMCQALYNQPMKGIILVPF